LSGEAFDQAGVSRVEICVDADCGLATLQPGPAQSPLVLEDTPAEPVWIGAAASCANPILRTYPVSEAFEIQQISLGFVAEHARRDDLQVTLTSPQGTSVLMLANDGLADRASQNYDMLLNDAATLSYTDFSGDHDPTGLRYENWGRPAQPARAFQGENTLGDWVLTICDTQPGSADGRYLASQLILIPRDAAAHTASWSFTNPGGDNLDYITQTVNIAAQDQLGNSTTAVFSFELLVDNVAPVVAVDTFVDQLPLGHTERVLAGTVFDGSPGVTVRLKVYAPDGSFSTHLAQRAAENWWYDLPVQLAGQYTLWVVATDQAGNVSTVGPYVVEAICNGAQLAVTSITAQPAGAAVESVALMAEIANLGSETLPVGVPVGFYANGDLIGSGNTLVPIAPGATGSAEITWQVAFAGDYEIVVVPNHGQALPLCSLPANGMRAITIEDLAIWPGWNLVASNVQPFNPAVAVIQLPMYGSYSEIVGYEGEVRRYSPYQPPDSNTLHTLDAEHAYWVKGNATAGTLAENNELGQVTTLRMIGASLPVETPIQLQAGWNLVNYLPARSMAITEALQSIAGNYTAVLGFEAGALSYYPDLAPAFNTLLQMEPDHGYWIHVNQAATLVYPQAGSALAPVRATGEPARMVLPFDQLAPTPWWVNFYGQAFGVDQPLAVGTQILAVNARGQVCGTAEVGPQGTFGLLACYSETPDPVLESAAVVTFMTGDGIILGDSRWTSFGDLHQLSLRTPTIYLPVISNFATANP
ncbi:MAG: proprotein convertase P-domain-containing protein, partial [Anaerolineales bacterium]|nr:proprotein convertase P-domain-containing protein [Anaerolineales bacterium]